LNLHRASEQLHITPSAVSQSLKNLESDLGIQLFVRTKKSVLPTEEAHQFFEKIVPPLQSLLNEIGHFLIGRIDQVPVVRIGAIESFGRMAGGPRASATALRSRRYRPPRAS
jgi:DNA-binding transcriptional LysR family regulator